MNQNPNASKEEYDNKIKDLEIKLMKIGQSMSEQESPSHGPNISKNQSSSGPVVEEVD